MKRLPSCWWLLATSLVATIAGLFEPRVACAATTVFFDASQSTNLVSSGVTSDTIASEGYLFTYTRDKLFTGGVGLTNPIGRTVRIPWPQGLEAQAVTAGPNPSGARMSISRQDGLTFAIESFTFKLLANTAGAGASLEIMPLLNGEDGLPNPVMLDATGYYGMNFSYNTPALTGFDAYKITLYVDFALLSLTVVDASLPPPSLDILQLDASTVELSWPTNAVGFNLVSTTSLPATLWDPVTNNAVVNGDFFTVQVTLDLSRRFFRLQK
jgi:hypothetical protein